jgi:hypothetical protein
MIGEAALERVAFLFAFAILFEVTRVLKQLLIGSVYVIILGSLGYGAYDLLTPDATCSDGIRNQGEEGPDCGTVCGILCVAPLEPLQVSEPRLWSSFVVTGGADVLVEIKNPNVIYGAVRMDWVLRLLDGSGQEQAFRRGFTYANPLSTRHLIISFPGIASGMDWTARFEYDPKDVQWVQGDQPVTFAVDFTILNPQLTIGDDGRVMYRADVRNDSTFNFDEVDVSVLLYNADDVPVAAGATLFRTLRTGEVRAFTIPWPELGQMHDPVRARVEVSTNFFDNENFIRTYGGQERFQGF